MEGCKNKAAREEYGKDYCLLSPEQQIALTDKIVILYAAQWANLRADITNMVTDADFGVIRVSEYNKHTKQVTVYTEGGEVYRIAIIHIN